MRLNARRLLGLIALAILVAVVALLLFRPQVAAPTAETASNPAAPIANAIPEVDPMPWAAVDWQPPMEAPGEHPIEFRVVVPGNRSETRIWMGSAN